MGELIETPAPNTVVLRHDRRSRGREFTLQPDYRDTYTVRDWEGQVVGFIIGAHSDEVPSDYGWLARAPDRATLGLFETRAPAVMALDGADRLRERNR
jgi:hypothetical protein